MSVLQVICWKQSDELVFQWNNAALSCGCLLSSSDPAALSSPFTAGPHRRRSDEAGSLPGHVRTLHRRLNSSSLGLRKRHGTRRAPFTRLCLPASKTSTIIPRVCRRHRHWPHQQACYSVTAVSSPRLQMCVGVIMPRLWPESLGVAPREDCMWF